VAERVSFGINEADKLLGGGMPPGSSYLMETDPGTEELCFVAAFLKEGLRQGNLCGVVLFDMPHEELISKFTDLGLNMKEALESGSMIMIDMWAEGKYDPENQGPILMTDNMSDLNSLSRLYYDLAKINDKRLKSGRFTGCRFVSLSLSSQIMNYKFEPVYKLNKMAMSMARNQRVLSVGIIDPNMFDETVVAAFEHLHDGVITLTTKQVGSRFRRFFRVKNSPTMGFYTDEVPYEIVDGKPSLLTPFAEPTISLRDHIVFNADGSISMAGSRFVLSNVIYTNTIMDYGVKTLGYDIVVEAVYNAFKGIGETEMRTFLSSLNINPSTTDLKRMFRLFASFLSNLGLGVAELVSYSDQGATYRFRNTLCSLHEQSDKPMAPYLAGEIAGAVGVIMGKPVICTETKCIARGDDYCEFDCQVTTR
jgi:KaiC/GvpD/RAD55 family RecA-like ATPase/predicted hydrocarbon binding protein